LSTQELSNGLIIEKITSPLGVVGIIYESRPNVTIDVAALCLRSGNACVLRGGSDAYHSNKKLVSLIHQALDKYGVDRNVVQLIPTNRKFVNELLNASRYVDIIIPRGSQDLIDFVRANSKVPTIETGAGVCHTYVNKDANLSKALDIVVNAKVSRPSVCNALDTVLIDYEVSHIFLPMLADQLKEYKVQIQADQAAFNILKGYPWLNQASEEDFGKEFLDFKCSIKVVHGFQEALDHIQQYSSKHSEAIISDNQESCDRFLQEVDAAAVYTNASTRFTDGGIFGLGAEIGISTQKLHARGPFALEKLITEKWIIRGEGQIRI
jgi:glutamate-5-semialdehyde dehydrogenase